MLLDLNVYVGLNYTGYERRNHRSIAVLLRARPAHSRQEGSDQGCSMSPQQCVMANMSYIVAYILPRRPSEKTHFANYLASILNY